MYYGRIEMLPFREYVFRLLAKPIRERYVVERIGSLEESK